MSLRNGAGLLLALMILDVSAAPAVSAQAADTAFASLQERGRQAMGVDQYTSAHRFDDRPDGGRIELQQNRADSAGVSAIRAHLAGIARSFQQGDFTIPGVVHAGPVPGTGTMAAKQKAIGYQFRPLPRGGEVRITTVDPQALQAIHQFLAFQRREHRAGGEHVHSR